MDTSVLQVQQLGDEYLKPEVGGSSVDGCKTCAFHVKNHVTCDYKVQRQAKMVLVLRRQRPTKVHSACLDLT